MARRISPDPKNRARRPNGIPAKGKPPAKSQNSFLMIYRMIYRKLYRRKSKKPFAGGDLGAVAIARHRQLSTYGSLLGERWRVLLEVRGNFEPARSEPCVTLSPNAPPERHARRAAGGVRVGVRSPNPATLRAGLRPPVASGPPAERCACSRTSGLKFVSSGAFEPAETSLAECS